MFRTFSLSVIRSPKLVEFYSKNKFEKLVHLFGFIIRRLQIYWDVNDIQIRHHPLTTIVCFIRIDIACLIEDV